jgi:hypothetical protein
MAPKIAIVYVCPAAPYTLPSCVLVNQPELPRLRLPVIGSLSRSWYTFIHTDTMFFISIVLNVRPYSAARRGREERH